MSCKGRDNNSVMVHFRCVNYFTNITVLLTYFYLRTLFRGSHIASGRLLSYYMIVIIDKLLYRLLLNHGWSTSCAV